MQGRKVLCIYTVILIVLVILFCFLQRKIQIESPEKINAEVSFLVNGTERIKLWDRGDEKFYVFLPSYGQLEDTSFVVGADTSVWLDGQQIQTGGGCDQYILNQEYAFVYENMGSRREGVLIFLKSENVAALHIDTASGNMEYIHMDKENEETGVLRLFESDGENTYRGALEIKGRGNTSWDAEKKPYNLTLNQEADLLGMGTASRWALLSEGYNSVVIRNKIVYDFARKIGLEYSPECQWVDLYLNGEYAGLYELSERNEVHPERVDISEENGGFLVSMEYESRLKEQKYPYILTTAGQALRVRSDTADMRDIQQRWQTVENAILSPDGMDPVSGKHWIELIDLDSWVRKYLIEEVFANLDAGSLSQFYYLDGNDPSGKIYAGPVWDYDFSMGGEDVWLKPYTDYFAMNRDAVNDEIYTPWFFSLYRQYDFLIRAKELYESEFLPELEMLIDEKIDHYVSYVTSASEMNRIRHFGEYTSSQELRAEFEYLKGFLAKRVAFLSDLWINETEYHIVCVDASINGYFAVKDGCYLPEPLRSAEVSGFGWHDIETDEPFDITQPIHEDVKLYVKKAESSLPKVHYIPAAFIVLISPVILLLDWTQNKQNRRPEHESAQVK